MYVKEESAIIRKKSEYVNMILKVKRGIKALQRWKSVGYAVDALVFGCLTANQYTDWVQAVVLKNRYLLLGFIELLN